MAKMFSVFSPERLKMQLCEQMKISWLDQSEHKDAYYMLEMQILDFWENLMKELAVELGL